MSNVSMESSTVEIDRSSTSPVSFATRMASSESRVCVVCANVFPPSETTTCGAGVAPGGRVGDVGGVEVRVGVRVRLRVRLRVGLQVEFGDLVGFTIRHLEQR